MSAQRFNGQRDAEFRGVVRRRLVTTRTALFCVFMCTFGLTPLYLDYVLPVPALIHSRIEWLCVAIGCINAAAALATTRNRDGESAKGWQTAAVLSTLLIVLYFRALGLRHGMDYPAAMLGIVLVAFAFLGGFTWQRIGLLALIFIGADIFVEYGLATPDSHPAFQIYQLGAFALISILGAYNQGLLAWVAWSENNKLRAAQEALRASESRFEAFMQHTPAIVWIKDAEGRYLYRNKAHQELYGRPGDDWRGRVDAELFRGEAVKTYTETDRKVLETGHAVEFEIANSDNEGRAREWWVNKFPIAEGDSIAVGGIGLDIRERHKLQQRLQASERQFHEFMDHSPAISWIKDSQGRYLYVNAAMKAFLGIQDDSWQLATDLEYFPHDFANRSYEIEAEVLRTGSTIEVEGEATNVAGLTSKWLLTRFMISGSDGEKYVGGIATDVTMRRRAEELVRLQSLSDELTGLYNRRGLGIIADKLMPDLIHRSSPCALIYVDLNNLRGINRDHKHRGGDQAIVATAEAIRTAVRDGDLVARVGGDEFVVFAPDCTDVASLEQAIIHRIDAYNATEGLPFQLSITMGQSTFVASEQTDLAAHIDKADERMFAEKPQSPSSL